MRGSLRRGFLGLLCSDPHQLRWNLKPTDLSGLSKSKTVAGLFSAKSGTACAAAWKPIFEWVPSQNGFVVDAPQQQSTVLS